MEKVIWKNIGQPNSHTFDGYVANGGYQALKKAVTMQPDEIVQEVVKSGVRGRGGAGFPTGQKWTLLHKDLTVTRYLAVNGDESEPGTFHDRYLIAEDPHQVLEGMIIACYALHIHHAFMYVRGEFTLGGQRMAAAIQELYERGYAGKGILGTGFDLEITLYRGAGAYICGEETALLSSLEGKRGMPKVKPPFPANVGGGLYGFPTVVQNVQTLCCVPHILNRGADWFLSIGTGPRGSGPIVYSVSGHVNKPGNYELPLGTPLRELIYEHCGGMVDNKAVKAVIPGGGSAQWLTAEQLDVKLDFDSVTAAGSMLGSASITVMNEDVCIPHCVTRLARFYHHESCGECTPCREGGMWIYKTLSRILSGGGREEDIPMLVDVMDNIGGKTLCPFGFSVIWPLQSCLKNWREEFDYHIRERRCPKEHPFGTIGAVPAAVA